MIGETGSPRPRAWRCRSAHRPAARRSRKHAKAVVSRPRFACLGLVRRGRVFRRLRRSRSSVKAWPGGSTTLVSRFAGRPMWVCGHDARGHPARSPVTPAGTAPSRGATAAAPRPRWSPAQRASGASARRTPSSPRVAVASRRAAARRGREHAGATVLATWVVPGAVGGLGPPVRSARRRAVPRSLRSLSPGDRAACQSAWPSSRPGFRGWPVVGVRY
jgi:hypothetical protein